MHSKKASTAGYSGVIRVWYCVGYITVQRLPYKVNVKQHFQHKISRSVLLSTAVIALAAMAILPTLAYSQGARDTLLMQYVRESWERHPDLESMRAMLAAESSRAAMSRAWENPEARFGLVNVPPSFDTHEDPNTMWEIGVSQKIPFPGKLSASRKAGRARIRATAANLEAARYETSGAVAEAYYDLAAALVVRKSLERGSGLLQQMIEASANLLNTGLGSQADVLRAQLESEQWKVKLLANEADIVRKRAALARAIGRHADEPLIDPLLPDSLPPIPDFVPSQIADSAKDTPRVRKAQLDVESARADVKRAKLDYWPDVELMASYGLRGYLRSSGGTDPMTGAIIPPGRIKRDPMISLELGIPIPLFYRGNQQARVRELSAMQRAREAEAASARLMKEEELQDLYAQWKKNAASSRLEVSTVLPRAEETWRSTLNEYRGGKATLVALSEARMAVIMAEVELLMHRADAWAAHYRWLAAMGQPLFTEEGTSK